MPRDIFPDPEELEKIRKAMIAAVDDKLGDKYAVKIDCPYAEFVEFGSNPAQSSSGGNKVADDGDMITPVNKEFRDWAEKKMGYIGKERKKVGDSIYRKVMKEGMEPHPFIRPAVYKLNERFGTADLDQFITKPEPYREIAESMVVDMKLRLWRGDNHVTGELMRSIHVVPENGVDKLLTIFDNKDEQILRDPKQGVNGKIAKNTGAE